MAEAVHAVDPDAARCSAWPARCSSSAAAELGLRTVAEAFADRAYRPDGQLVSRRERNAVLQDPDEIAERVISMVTAGRVAAVDGSTIPITVESVCVHGDSRGCRADRHRGADRLLAEGVDLSPFS